MCPRIPGPLSVPCGQAEWAELQALSLAKAELLHHDLLGSTYLVTYIILIVIFFFYFILLYNTVLVLPYINMNPPRVYTCSQS